MKTTATLKNQILYFLYVAILMLANVNKVSGQRLYRQAPKMFLGLEVGTGPRSFKIDSDIKEIDNLTVNEEGLNFGLTFGINNVQLRGNGGTYKASDAVGQRIDMSEFSMGANFLPLKLPGKNGKYIRPYLTGMFTVNKVTFFGSYALPQPAAAVPAPAIPPCTCTCPGSAPPDPPVPADEPIEIESENSLAPTPVEELPPLDEKELGSVRSFRADLGVGILFKLPTQRVFMNFFAEAKYGLTLNQESGTYGFLNTKISDPFIINLGIAIGLKN